MTTQLRPAAPRLSTVAPKPAPQDGVEIITPDQYADRRTEVRQDCNNRGSLLFLSSNEIVPCRILDQSASGARVSMDQISHVPQELWLIDLETNIVKCGSAAWSMANRMGLKFSLIQKITPGQPCPARVPGPVYEAWQRLSGNEDKPDDDVLFFD